MSKATESIELSVEAFAILIKSAAQAIINELEKSASKVDAAFLHERVGMLDELVSKFEILHHREQDKTRF